MSPKWTGKEKFPQGIGRCNADAISAGGPSSHPPWEEMGLLCETGPAAHPERTTSADKVSNERDSQAFPKPVTHT